VAEGIPVDWQSLQAFAQEVFEAVGLTPQDARTEAEVLVWANLRGIDSHGVLRIPQYVRSVEAGAMNPHPDIHVERETPASLLIEADHAFGPVVTVLAMNRIVEKARVSGLALAFIRNTTHQGAMGYYPLMAAKEGLAGLALVCNPPNMAPYGARSAGVHNSPIAIAVPGEQHQALILDMATSVAAGGKVSLAIDKGIPIPEGWALDKEGQPTTDPRRVGALLPVGGPKGSGLALMFECLSSLMVGNPLLESSLTHGTPVPLGTQNSVVGAIDIAAFTALSDYRRHVDTLIAGIKRLPPAEGFSEVLLPGELEDRVCAERKRHGVPLPKGTVANLRHVAEGLGVAYPQEFDAL